MVAIFFFIIGIYALMHILSPILAKLIPASLLRNYTFQFTQKTGDNVSSVSDLEFTSVDLSAFVISGAFCSWYLWKKHWVANNLIGLALSINFIELLLLNTILIGCVLLGGLFVYDIFWVFGTKAIFNTSVMASVAESFEAPIKLLFPLDFLANGFSATDFSLLGLGDIVLPGI